MSKLVLQQFSIPVQLMQLTTRIMIDDSKELFSLGKPQGDFELRETIARYLFAARGVLCTPEQIVVFCQDQ